MGEGCSNGLDVNSCEWRCLDASEREFGYGGLRMGPFARRAGERLSHSGMGVRKRYQCNTIPVAVVSLILINIHGKH